MYDYTVFYLLMIVAGIILAVWSISKRNKVEPPAPPHPVPPIKKETIPEPPIQLAKEVSHIYTHNEANSRSIRRVWVCRDCEMENHEEEDHCILCGAPKY